MRVGVALLACACSCHASWMDSDLVAACPPLTPRAPPDAVKELKPVDIKVVGAMGDSLTAGFAINGFPVEDRDEVYVTGDRANATTMANFFNHYGNKVAVQNVAVSGDVVQGMDKQAKRLISAIKGDNAVNFEHDWKLVTILIGGNNQCPSCYGAAANQPQKYSDDLKSALDILKKGLPRTLVSLISMVNLASLASASGVAQHCALQHILTKAECPCPFAGASDVAKMVSVIKQDNKILYDISKGYATADFGVVVQPGLDMMSVPDWTYLSRFDCFHPSLITHQQIAIALWTNLFQPIGKKTDSFQVPVPMYCPTDDDIIYSEANADEVVV